LQSDISSTNETVPPLTIREAVEQQKSIENSLKQERKKANIDRKENKKDNQKANDEKRINKLYEGMEVCYEYLKGRCPFKQGVCIFEHPTICNKHKTTGNCNYGENCKYYHVKLCKYIIEKGTCLYRKNCKFFHPIICKYYKENRCRSSPCTYYHPPHLNKYQRNVSYSAKNGPNRNQKNNHFLAETPITQLLNLLTQVSQQTHTSWR